MSAIADIIAAAAQRRGINPRALTGIAKIESGLNPNARNPRSSAGGLFQFIDGTAKQYGLGNKFDPEAAADAGARLAADNGSAIARALGRPATPGELYLAHQQGSGGAVKLLRNPDAPAAQVVGEKAFSLNGGVPGMTAGQFAQKWTSKLDAAMGNASDPAPAAAPPAGQAPQAGTSLAQALPGATLPTFNPGPDPVLIAAAMQPPAVDVEPLRQQQAQAEQQARRRALLSIGSAFG
jgi:hypothetical protein